MTTSHWSRQHSFKTPDMTSDIVIVGGGYAGLSSAYWITQLRPDLKVTILERSTCGAGASGRNAGFLTIGSASFYKSLCLKWGSARALKIHEFAKDSLELVNQQILKSSPEIKFDRTSSMTLFQSEQQLQSWSHDEFSCEQFGFNWRPNEELASELKPKFFGSFESGPEYKINPMQLMNSLKKILESRKVNIVESNSAFDITSEGIQTEVNFVKTKQVVLALNGYLPQFNHQFKQIITPRRAQMLAVELVENFECPNLYYDPPERVYWRKSQEKVLVIGGKRLLDEDGETGDFEKISPLVQKGLEDYLTNQLNLKYKVINRWSGIMGFTEHELPLVGKVNAPLDAYMIGGFSGHGMGLGFNSAKSLAELVTGHIGESFFDQFKKVDISL
jgi:gamma-glutamylputrescine oxidase